MMTSTSTETETAMNTMNTTMGTGTGTVRKRDASTLFVRNIHPSITRVQLEEYFSDVGPVKKCSIVRPPGDSNKARGGGDGGGTGGGNNRLYGFVKFANEDDATRALEALRAKKSESDKSKNDDDAMFRALIVEHADSSHTSSTQGGSHSHPHSQRRDGGGGVDEDAVLMARRKRTSRVIVRNLSFHATSNNVRTVMAKFGNIADVHLPTVPTLHDRDDDGKKKGRGRRRKQQQQHRGFAFVTYEDAGGARMAVEACTEAASDGGGILIKNRPVAIDFSVSKVQHDRMRREEEMEEEEQEREGEGEGEDVPVDEDDGGGDGGDYGGSGRSEEDEKEGGVAAAASANEDGDDDDSDDDESSSSGSSSSSSSSSSSDSDSDSDSSDDSDSTSSTSSSDVGHDDDGDDGDDDDVAAGKSAESSSPSEKTTKPSPPPPPSPPPDDVDQRRTIFVRNVPFDATRHALFSTFRTYGKIDGAYLVKDKSTGLCRGTAFVKFADEKGCEAALEAGAASDTAPFVSSSSGASFDAAGGVGGATGDVDGIFLSGRRLLVDLAVDRTTASSFAPVERDSNGKAIKKFGKDRRNLYLKMEGHVSGEAWDVLPEMDRERRRRANVEKNSKLKSPTFFVNPNRLSVRNLAKHVTEVELRKLVVEATVKGLKDGDGEGDGVVTEEDVKAQLRAKGMSPRECVGDAVKVPPFDVKNTKRYIPSVYIDRDKLAFEGRAKKNQTGATPPSKGFAFVEFTHHAHALACLRELNNNPRYSEDFATKGKQAAAEAARSKGLGTGGGKKRGRSSSSGFVGEDGKVKVPRLIVEFAVENMVKAKQQAHRRAQQLANAEQQRLLSKKNKDGSTSRKKRGRGSIQREKKRQRKMAEGAESNSASKIDILPGSAVRNHVSKDDIKSEESERTNLPQPGTKMMKKIKPPKKRKVDKEEVAFEEMVRSYKATFSGIKKQTGAGMQQQNAANEPSRAKVAERRWFE